jgi:hypothetical protein
VSTPNPRYPLSWPSGWQRTPPNERRASNFSSRLASGNGRADLLTLATGLRRLVNELDRLRADAIVISTDVPVRRDGMPYASAALPKDPGCAVYFTLRRQPRVLACDRYTRLPDNMAAIAAHIDALRAIERYGVGTLDQAFAGYAALPAPVADAVQWWDVLRVERTASLDDCESAFRRLARDHHPDRGGSHDDMAKLTSAIAVARKSVRA